MDRDDLIRLAWKEAEKWGLNPIIVCAICENESSWNPNAIRFERIFYDHYEMKKDLPDTEKLNRSASFGLMQVLGETARDLGFNGAFDLLYDPELNIYLGCKKLKQCSDKHPGNMAEALSEYNGGGDPGYANRVLARVKNYMAPVLNSVEKDLES